MDFGGGSSSMDGLVSVSSEFNGFGLFPSISSSESSEHSKRRGLFGSAGCFKHGRTSVAEESEWSRLTMGRVEPMPAATSKAATCQLRSSSLFPDGEQMLSFSSSKPDALLLNNDWTFPFYQHPSSSSASSYLRNSGVGSISSNANIHGVVAGSRGPFTPSQWLELEHQALIYKYIDAKVPIPSSLLIPIRPSINAFGFTTFNTGPHRSAGTLGWGSFHPGFSASADPEPGRCRRTDGKKWRCSRDAVTDQKYCERHMNRGRHRSRKHVEGHNGHAAKAPVSAITSSQSASAISSGGSSNNLPVAQQHIKGLQPRATQPAPALLGRLQMNKENDTTEHSGNSRGLSMLNNSSPKATATLFPTLKQQNPIEGTSACSDLGLISSDSLPHPRGSPYLESLSFVMSSPEMNGQHPTRSHSLRHFIDDWPKNTSNCSTITWPNVDKMQSERTQLSISVPMASSDFSYSSSSPNQDKLSSCPHEFNLLNDGSVRPSNWIPISWEPTIGGPLGEVLTNTSSTSKDLSRNLSSSSLNLLTDGWNLSPRLESSPTGVLQKTGFGSLSSSAGSSPRGEKHKAHEADDLIGSTLVDLSATASLKASDRQMAA